MIFLQNLSEHERNLSDLFNGRFPRDKVLLAAEIPFPVASILRWQARGVNISALDAEKIRFHKSHGMTSAKAMKVVQVEIIISKQVGHQGCIYTQYYTTLATRKKLISLP